MSHKKDLWSSLFFLILSLLLFFWVTPNYVDSPKFGIMSARYFPNLGTILLFFSSLSLFISALLKIKKDKTSSDDFPKKEASKRKTFDLKTLRPFRRNIDNSRANLLL